MSTEAHRVRVWPAVVRLTHWTLAGSALVLMATGWLLQTGLVASDELYELLAGELHRPAGYAFAIALAARLFYLLADRKGVAGWRALVPDSARLDGIRETLRFYSALGSGRPPRCYAYNPLWGSLYLVFFGLAAAQAASGLVLDLPFLRSLVHADEAAVLAQHGRLAEWILVWCVFHAVTAVLHDWRGQGSDVSALISGYRIFVPEHPPTDAVGTVPTVRLDDIGRPVLTLPRKDENE